MADNRSCQFCQSPFSREPICINADRVYDSCCDKDCLSDLRVYFTSPAQSIVDNATSVRCRKAEIINCCIDVEPVSFNKGYYSVDITYFFKLTLDAFTNSCASPAKICGLTSFTKKCVLYGSEGNVKVFSSEYAPDEYDCPDKAKKTNPKVKVQTVDPVVLDSTLCEIKDCCECNCCDNMPATVARAFDGTFDCHESKAAVKVTLGLFSIVRLERETQILVPSAEFCIPKKECCCNSDDPCDSFKKIRFPVSEFFPPSKCCDK